ncbi:hypothetical protein [Ruminococcus sp.]|uniref:hypothetical protein n=1 Tax=Ruminococcus sp. TaxID=41978 RepID=UPI0025FF589D|nr:hypothetical protein [Ruminococcus sp.]
MRKYENHCVDCELPCLGSSCPYVNVPVDYCDECGNDNAEYVIDGDDLCEDCAEKYLKEVFNDLTLSEKADAVDIDLHSID